MNSGIYQIRNKRNHRIYIGCTMSLKERWISHRALLRNNKHKNPELQSDWNKYGESAFVFEVIVSVEHTFYLYRVEREVINQFVNKTNLYNIAIPSPIGTKSTGVISTQ